MKKKGKWFSLAIALIPAITVAAELFGFHIPAGVLEILVGASTTGVAGLAVAEPIVTKG